MVTKLIESDILIYIMSGLCIFGVLLKFIIARIYGSLVKASDHMSTTTNKMIKSLRLKFETNYSMNLGVHNVDIFVDKYVYMNKFCGIFLYTWENLSGQTILLCMLTGTVGSVLGLLYDCGKQDILSTLFVGVLTSAALIIVEHLSNLPVKKYVIRTNIKDYLENFLTGKLEMNRARNMGRQGENLMNQVKSATISEKIDNKTTMSQKELAKLCEIDKNEEKIINDILNEYII